MAKGWHQESHRHRLARQGVKTGRKEQSRNMTSSIASARFNQADLLSYGMKKEHKEHPELSKVEALQIAIDHIQMDKNYYLNEYLKEKEPNKDFDGDGVINKKDCVPSDPNKQDLPFPINRKSAERVVMEKEEFEKKRQQSLIDRKKAEKEREMEKKAQERLIKKEEESIKEKQEEEETINELEEQKLLDEEQAVFMRRQASEDVARLQEEVQTGKEMLEEDDDIESDTPQEYKDPVEEEYHHKKKLEKEIELELEVARADQRIKSKEKQLDDVRPSFWNIFGKPREQRIAELNEKLRVAQLDSEIARKQALVRKLSRGEGASSSALGGAFKDFFDLFNVGSKVKTEHHHHKKHIFPKKTENKTIVIKTQ